MSTGSIGPIEFIDLKAQRRRIGARMDRAIAEAIDGGNFILGPQVVEFEQKIAAFCGARHAIGVANGTDAIGLVLMALKARPGDAVICPSFTFASTAEAVAWLGATPVFADIDERTYNVDPAGLAKALDTAVAAGLKPRAVIAVDLFGQAADYDAIEDFCRAHGLTLICDSAQGFAADYKGRLTGSIGDVATTSFFPAKPLGCYGDGGAVFTGDDALADLIRSLRSHGKGGDKYDNVNVGMNSRLDTLQAAILLEKLAIYGDEIEARDRIAARYTAALAELVPTPHVLPGCRSVWAQYTIRVPAANRAGFMAAMKSKGVPTNVYYPKPLHQQTAYRRFPVAGGSQPVSEKMALEVVSLPMHPYLAADVQDYIVAAVRAVLSGT